MEMNITKEEVCNKGPVIGNEQGSAMIIVLLMLLLLTIIGASMMATSTSELQIAGNYRNSEEAFYTADSVMEFAQMYSDIYMNITATSVLWPATNGGKQLGSDFSAGDDNVDNGKNPDFKQYNRLTFTSANGKTNTADVKVELVGSGKPPAGYGIQEDSSISPGSTSYKANYFAISVIAYGQNDTTAKLESQIARIVQQ